MNSQQEVKWPDWIGQTAVIVATGPSAKDEPLSQVRGRARVIVVKTSWQLAPWADVLYGCDRGWWIENRGVPKFKGLKISPSPTVCKVYKDVKLVRLVARAEILTGEIGRIGCGLRTGGGHSGFHAINLAVQFGAKRIVLVGFDMTLDNGPHWHPHDPGTARRKDATGLIECRDALDGCASQFTALGIEVINASEVSALKAYPKRPLIEAIGDGAENAGRADPTRHRIDDQRGIVAEGAVAEVRDVRPRKYRRGQAAERPDSGADTEKQDVC